jgi:shikimate kinase
MINSHVIVLGYMGCGKSTIARKLSSIIDIPFIDLDKYIETKHNMTIPEIFDSKGEIKFREIEKETLEKLLMQKDKIIISIGGGTPCYFENMQYILNTTVSTLANRLFYEKDSRPLIKSINDINKLKEFISKHLFERMVYYRKSNHIIDGNDNDVENICNQILKKLI